MPIVTCANCGKELKKNTYNVNRSKIHFCGQKCSRSFGRVEKVCQQCGEKFTTKKSNVGKFCSRKCVWKWQSIHRPKKPVKVMFGKDHPNYSDKIKVNCAQCGKTIEATAWQLSQNRKYCSSECYGIAQRTRPQAPCDYCGKTVTIEPRQNRSTKHHFCNQKCRGAWLKGANNPAWIGGTYPLFGENWKNQRRAALERDGYTCQRCGKCKYEHGVKVEVHHIVPRRKFTQNIEKANDLSNLVTLCSSCHRKVESRKVIHNERKTQTNP